MLNFIRLGAMYIIWENPYKKEVLLLSTDAKCGKLMTVDGWLICPNCRQKKIQPFLRTSTARRLPVHCKKCGADSIVNIAEGYLAELVEIVPRGVSLSLRA